jgi:galactoside O-acetyltransferase
MALKNSFYNDIELQNLGFKSVGQKVLISKKASFYNISNITIGNNVRIDDFCILSGKIKLESNIHISAYCALYASLHEIHMKDFSGLSPKTIIFSASDDFSGEYLISPMVDEKYTNVTGGKVIIERYVQIGAGCIILPDVVINEGAVVGSMSLVKTDLESWSINFGIPARKQKDRKKELLKFV